MFTVDKTEFPQMIKRYHYDNYEAEEDGHDSLSPPLPVVRTRWSPMYRVKDNWGEEYFNREAHCFYPYGSRRDYDVERTFHLQTFDIAWPDATLICLPAVVIQNRMIHVPSRPVSVHFVDFDDSCSLWKPLFDLERLRHLDVSWTGVVATLSEMYFLNTPYDWEGGTLEDARATLQVMTESGRILEFAMSSTGEPIEDSDLGMLYGFRFNVGALYPVFRIVKEGELYPAATVHFVFELCAGGVLPPVCPNLITGK